ncbi:hypothetical protein ORI60_22340 [Lentzea sp. NEAU-D7]|nr:hypothetical protein [Lentzea sp. NEAU-D7]
MTSRIVADTMLMKILAPVDAPRSVLLGTRTGAGLGLGRGAGASAFAFAGVVRTVGRSAIERGRGADDEARAGSRLGVARRGGSARPADSRRGGSTRFGGSRRGGSTRFGGSRRGGSPPPGCLRGGSAARGGTCGRRG